MSAVTRTMSWHVPGPPTREGNSGAEQNRNPFGLFVARTGGATDERLFACSRTILSVRPPVGLHPAATTLAAAAAPQRPPAAVANHWPSSTSIFLRTNAKFVRAAMLSRDGCSIDTRCSLGCTIPRLGQMEYSLTTLLSAGQCAKDIAGS